MKAFLTRSLTSLDALNLGDAETPEPGAGEIAIALDTTSLQLADLAFALGQRTPKPRLPFIPGLEGAGRIARVGSGVNGFKPGDPVVAFLPAGGLAEVAVTKAALAAPLPDGVSPTAAAALPHAYAGALLALRSRAALKPGETLLVLGAGGRMGLAAIDIGKHLGATVIAVANGKDRQTAAEEQGADHVIDPGSTPLADTLAKPIEGRGADVIFDPVGGDAASAALRAASYGARYILAGFAGGATPRLDTAQLFAKNAALIAANTVLLAEHEPDAARHALADVLAWTAAGKLKPRIAAKFALKDAKAAVDFVRARRGIGAAIVTVS